MKPRIELFDLIFIDGQYSSLDGVRVIAKGPWSMRKRAYNMPEEVLYFVK